MKESGDWVVGGFVKVGLRSLSLEMEERMDPVWSRRCKHSCDKATESQSSDTQDSWHVRYLLSETFSHKSQLALLPNVIKREPETLGNTSQFGTAEDLRETVSRSIPDANSTKMTLVLHVQDPFTRDHALLARWDGSKVEQSH